MKRRLQKLLVAGLDEIEAEDERRSNYKINTRFPDTGPYRRGLYEKQVALFRAGATYRERCMIAANRVGKTDAGAFETALHLTGLYPHWWEGRRFDEAVSWWAAGDSSKTVRDILQEKLIGPPGRWGTGFIPQHLIEKTSMKQGVADAIETAWVRHVSGDLSVLNFKSYDQRRESFQGTAQHGIWLDEEPQAEIYDECLLRTMKTSDFPGGLVLMTFTPLKGHTPLVVRLRTSDGSSEDSRFVVRATWDDVPHLSAEEKAALLASIPPHLRDPRTKGIPQLGVGAIYPVPESDIVVPDFKIPNYWPRGYGLDVGWNKTAAVWGALDRETSTIYLYDAYYRGEAEPVVHTSAIKSRGVWIPGRIDPAAEGRGQADGRRIMQMYLEQGLKLATAPNALEAGIYEVWTLLSTGRLRVFESLRPWFEEFRMYRRDEKGKVVKEDDHLMDATRYFVLSGVNWLRTVPPQDEKPRGGYLGPNLGPHGWMA